MSDPISKIKTGDPPAHQKEQPGVLIVQRSSNLDGSAFSALLLANGFRDAGWKTLVAFGFEGPIIERFWKAGHEAVVVPHDNWLRRAGPARFLKDYLNEWRSANAFRPFLSPGSIDLVYVNSVVSLAGAVAARQTDTPCIWHLRELFADTGGEMHCPRLLRPVVRWTLQNLSTKLIANSIAVAHNMLGAEAGGDCIVVPNAAQDPFFDKRVERHVARARFSLPADGKIIGLPGTLRPMKGHAFLFAAAAPLLREDSTLSLAITGEGEANYRRELENRVDQLGIAKQVRFLETVQDMPAFYQACDLVCIPSRAEPFGRTVIEAFASGTPVVASAVGGIREIVTDGETGILVPYGDTESLTKALSKLLKDPGAGQKMAQAAYARARDKYREGSYQETLVAIASSLAGTRTE